MTGRDFISRAVAGTHFGWLGRPQQILYFGHGIGDDLLCTAVARELRKRGTGKIAMLSRHPGLFLGNPDISRVVDLGSLSVGRLRRWGYPCAVPQYGTYDAARDRDIYANEHFITTMCRMAGVIGLIELRPYIYLTSKELGAGRIASDQGVIQSTGLMTAGAARNKNWFPERFQSVARALAPSLRLIQLGNADDPPLEGTLDLRGKTTLRESAAILAASRVFIGQVGFLMHLARAVECPAVVVYGGRETPQVDGYTANENLTGPTACSPCWQRNRCDFGHACMEMIGVDAVVAAAHRQLRRTPGPLRVDGVEIVAG